MLVGRDRTQIRTTVLRMSILGDLYHECNRRFEMRIHKGEGLPACTSCQQLSCCMVHLEVPLILHMTAVYSMGFMYAVQSCNLLSSGDSVAHSASAIQVVFSR